MYYYQNIILAINIILPVLAIIAVGLRFQARAFQKVPIKWDDWVILMALIATLADAIYCIVVVFTANYGNLILLLTPDQTINYFKFIYCDVILTSLIFGLIKISVVLFYKRIFVIQSFKIVANVFLAICGAWTIAGVFSAIFRDNPISDYWNYGAKTSYDFAAWNIAMAVLDIALDLSILSLPLPVIKTLQISRSKKLSLIGIFGLGIFCVVASSVRLYYGKYLTDVANSPGFTIQHPEDATYIANSATLWSHIECSVSIITACLPTLVPLASKLGESSLFKHSWNYMLSRISLLRSSVGSRNHDTDTSDAVRLHSKNDQDSTTEAELVNYSKYHTSVVRQMPRD